MSKPANPDIFRPVDVPASLSPYVRRILVADSPEPVEMSVEVRPTGYGYLGWTWRGTWQADVNNERIFDTDEDGPLHLTGQIRKSEVGVRFLGNIAQIFLEFTALGQFELLGILGADMAENAVAPQKLNPALNPYLASIFGAGEVSVAARIELLASALSGLPKHTVPTEMVAAVSRMEAADGDIKIAALVRDMDMSERKFRSEFFRLIGLSPKAFCKVLQINRAFNQILQSKGGNLADVALEAGFSDQAHFSREFCAFLGNAPQRYLKNIEATLERFVGHSRS